MNKTTTAIITIASILVIVGTTLTPSLLQQQGDAASRRHQTKDGNFDPGVNESSTDATAKHKKQNINQENVCVKSNVCNNSNVAQETLGNDNKVTGFADQSETNSPKTNLTAGTGPNLTAGARPNLPAGAGL
jgi:hypothetical protein